MIDHHTLETTAALACIAALGGIVIFSMRGPRRRDLDAEGHVMDFDRAPPAPRPWQQDPSTGAVYRAAPVVSVPRYFVDDFAEVDGFHVEDRNTGLTIPQPYKTRSTALRAARRLNAKAELDAANGRLA